MTHRVSGLEKLPASTRAAHRGRTVSEAALTVELSLHLQV